MALHADPIVDLAMRANLGAGFHFWDPDTSRFFKSKPVVGVKSADGRFAYVVERYRRVEMGGHCVQLPHSRIVRVSLEGETKGETDYLRATGKFDGFGGEYAEFSTNAKALKFAQGLAGVTP